MLTSGPKNRRNLPRIDYTKFYETGDEVDKDVTFNEEITLGAKGVEGIDLIMFSVNEMVWRWSFWGFKKGHYLE